MFKCKVCAAKDELVTQLKSEVAYLRELAIPQNDPYTIPPFLFNPQQVLDQVDELVPHIVETGDDDNG